MTSNSILTSHAQSLIQVSTLTPVDHPENHIPLSTPNKLIGCAENLLAILKSLQLKETGKSADTITNEILLELAQFASKAREFNYQEESILISQFVICRTLDEYLLEHIPNAESLVDSFPIYQTLRQKFSIALEKMCQMPQVFTDILEFIFIINMLSRHYDKKEDNQYLFKLIQNQRGETEKKLSNKYPEHASPEKPKRRTAFWLSIVFTLIIVIIAYAGFSFLFSQSTKPLQQQISHVQTQKADITTTSS